MGDFLGDITLLASSGLAFPLHEMAVVYKLKDGSYAYFTDLASTHPLTGAYTIKAPPQPLSLCTLAYLVLIYPIQQGHFLE